MEGIHFLFKIVLVGNSAVGKSSILRRYADDQFSESYLTTIGVDFRFKSFQIDSKNVKLQIWDTAGQQRFRTLTSTYYKGSHAIIMVYDITSKESFADLNSYWLQEIEKYGDKNVLIVLLGNKCDCQQRTVSVQEGEQFARVNSFLFVEASAKTGDQISQAFEAIARHCMTKYPQSQARLDHLLAKINRRKQQIKLQQDILPSTKKKSCKC